MKIFLKILVIMAAVLSVALVLMTLLFPRATLKKTISPPSNNNNTIQKTLTPEEIKAREERNRLFPPRNLPRRPEF